MIEMLISGAGLATRQVRTMTSAKLAPLNTDSKLQLKIKITGEQSKPDRLLLLLT